MANELVVAFTLGQRDIQVLTVGPDERLCRVSPDKDTVGDFHRGILADPGRFAFWLPAALNERLDEPRRGEAIWEHGSIRLTVPGHRLAERVPGNDDERCWLTFGLLWKSLRALESDVKSGASIVKEILLFHTDRGSESDRSNSEPVAAAPSLRRWLIDHLALPEETVRLVQCLTEDERLTTRDRSGNTHLLVAAAQRIDTAVRSAARRFSGATARLHVSGGIPALSEVVQAATQLYFAPRVQYRSPTEDPAEANPTTLSSPATSAEVLQTRRRVRDLVMRGEFAAAAALAAPFDGTAPSNDWAALTLAVSQYFRGYRGSAAGQAGKRTASRTATAIGELCTSTRPDCLHIALRGEAALRRNDVFSAASSAITFLDVSMLDATEAVLSVNPSKDCIDWNDGMLIFSKSKANKPALRSAAQALIGMHGWIHDFDENDIEWWLKRAASRIGPPWQELAVVSVMRSVGSDALAEGMERLVTALNRPMGSPAPVKFRNVVTHSLPDEKEITSATSAFEKAGLWAKRNKTRTFLHSDGPASAVLTALGVADPLNLYDDLVAALVHDIEECPLA